jgi:hypothetical protein
MKTGVGIAVATWDGAANSEVISLVCSTLQEVPARTCSKQAQQPKLCHAADYSMKHGSVNVTYYGYYIKIVKQSHYKPGLALSVPGV